VDPARVGIYGWSYGGFMTIRSLEMAPETFACGVAGAPVTDFRNYDSIYTERYMGLPADNPEGYAKSSAVQAADKLKGRLLLVHNFEDDNVLFQNTVQMAAALERAGKQFELMVYPNKSHGLAQDRSHFDELLVSFFDRCLR
jgi:dipeptidyl-peptidase-4